MDENSKNDIVQEAVARFLRRYSKCLNQTIKALAQKNDQHAKEWINAAIQFEKENIKLLEQIRKTTEQELREAKQ